jgi:hypothetical protein
MGWAAWSRLGSSLPTAPPYASVEAKRDHSARLAAITAPTGIVPASYASHISTKTSIHGPSYRSSSFQRATPRS